MPDEDGHLNQSDVAQIDRFLGRHCPDKRMSCPVTGERVPVVQWRITNRLCLCPLTGIGLSVSKDHVAMLHMVSPAGGVVLLDAVAVGLVRVAKVN